MNESEVQERPKIDRRRFILGTGAALGSAALLGACDERAPSAAIDARTTPTIGSAPPFDPTDWDSVRAQFDLDPSMIHLAAFVLASHPQPVREAIRRYAEELDRDPYGYLGPNELALEDEVRSVAGSYLGVSAQEIALTDSTTMGLALVYNGLQLKPGQELLSTTHDFYSTHESIRLRGEREGASWRHVELFKKAATATVDEIAGNVRRAVRPETRALAVTWVHSSTGMKLPIRAIADVLEDVNRDRDEDDRILLCVDGVHGFGNQDVSPFEIGCDFLASGCHKWLFGPRGTGIVWGKLDAWRWVRPTIPSFGPSGIIGWIQGLDGPTESIPSEIQTPGGFHSFENRWALKEAFEFHQAIGRDRVAARTAELAARMKDGIAEVDSIDIVTPMDPELSAGIVCFQVKDVLPQNVMSGLMSLRRISVSVTPYAETYVRIGTSIVNSDDEVDETLRVLRSFA